MSMQQTSFSFAQLDPRPVGKEANEKLFAEHKEVLGIEVTIPSFSAQCSLGNLDHHGPEDTVETPSACDQALTCKIPPRGSLLVTVRCDADSVCGMAILASREQGREIDRELVSQVDLFDRLGPKADISDHRVFALGRVAADFKKSLSERVSWVQELLEGRVSEKEIEEFWVVREKEFAAAREASELEIYGDIVTVVSTHRFATQLGYEHALVVVAQNPQMPVDFRDPEKGTYNKFTVCKFDSHVALDLEGAMAELNVLEGANGSWGGQKNIKGSPQGVNSSLSLEEVLQVVKKYYDADEK